MTKLEVADETERFVRGTGGQWDWDEFMSFRLADPELESIRLMCARLSETHPPTKPGYYCSEEGLRVLEETAKRLRI